MGMKLGSTVNMKSQSEGKQLLEFGNKRQFNFALKYVTISQLTVPGLLIQYILLLCNYIGVVFS